MKEKAKQNPGIAHMQRSNKKRQGPRSLGRMRWALGRNRPPSNSQLLGVRKRLSGAP